MYLLKAWRILIPCLSLLALQSVWGNDQPPIRHHRYSNVGVIIQGNANNVSVNSSQVNIRSHGKNAPTRVRIHQKSCLRSSEGDGIECLEMIHESPPLSSN